MELIDRGDEVMPWNRLDTSALGLMRYFDDAVQALLRADARRVPDLGRHKRLYAVSDYAGDHQASDFRVVSSLFLAPESAQEWDRMRWEVRRRFLSNGRRMEFKKLQHDLARQRALPAFLEAAERIPGLLVSIAVHKSVESLFALPEFFEGVGDLAAYAHWPRATFERALRVIHFTAFFVAGTTSPGQDVLFITDEDEIAAHATRLSEFTNAFANVVSHYLPHTLGHIRIATTRSDDKTHRLEDLASIPDLAAGTVAAYATSASRGRVIPTAPLILPPPKMPLKAEYLTRWLGFDGGLLRKLVCLVYLDESRAGKPLMIKWLRYEQQEPMVTLP